MSEAVLAIVLVGGSMALATMLSNAASAREEIKRLRERNKVLQSEIGKIRESSRIGESSNAPR